MITQKEQDNANQIGIHGMLCQTQEECGELIKAIGKYNRTRGYGQVTETSQAEALRQLVEEIADVEICIKHIKWLMGIRTESIKKDKIEKVWNRYREKQLVLGPNNVNVKIKAHCLSGEEMKTLGFSYRPESNSYYFLKELIPDITFNLTIYTDNYFKLDILDEYCLQPYDYQKFISERGENAPKAAWDVYDKVEELMEYLQNAGVLSGHIKGEYI